MSLNKVRNHKLIMKHFGLNWNVIYYLACRRTRRSFLDYFLKTKMKIPLLWEKSQTMWHNHIIPSYPAFTIYVDSLWLEKLTRILQNHYWHPLKWCLLIIHMKFYEILPSNLWACWTILKYSWKDNAFT